MSVCHHKSHVFSSVFSFCLITCMASPGAPSGSKLAGTQPYESHIPKLRDEGRGTVDRGARRRVAPGDLVPSPALVAFHAVTMLPQPRGWSPMRRRRGVLQDKSWEIWDKLEARSTTCPCMHIYCMYTILLWTTDPRNGKHEGFQMF